MKFYLICGVKVTSIDNTEGFFQDKDLEIMRYFGGLSDSEIKKIKCFMSLPDDGIQKIERINTSIAARAAAEGQCYKHGKFQVLFERAARETLPFIIYVIYIPALNKISIFNVLAYEDKRLYIGTGLIILMLLIPLLFFFIIMRLYDERDKRNKEKRDNRSTESI